MSNALPPDFETAVPPENRPGHHPEEEQDKPDIDAFAAKLGTSPPEDRPAALEAEAQATSRSTAPRPWWRRPELGAGVAALLAVAYLLRRRRRS